MAIKGVRDRLSIEQPGVGDVTSSRKSAEQLQLGSFKEFHCTRDNTDLCNLDWFCRKFYALLRSPF